MNVRIMTAALALVALAGPVAVAAQDRPDDRGGMHDDRGGDHRDDNGRYHGDRRDMRDHGHGRYYHHGRYYQSRHRHHGNWMYR